MPVESNISKLQSKLLEGKNLVLCGNYPIPASQSDCHINVDCFARYKCLQKPFIQYQQAWCKVLVCTTIQAHKKKDFSLCRAAGYDISKAMKRGYQLYTGTAPVHKRNLTWSAGRNLNQSESRWGDWRYNVEYLMILDADISQYCSIPPFSYSDWWLLINTKNMYST